MPRWDYASPGIYFITICTYQREWLFDNLKYREAVETAWLAIPQRRHAQDHVALDESIVMPDHFHGILLLTDHPPQYNPLENNKDNLQSGSVGAIIGNLKSIVTTRINVLRRSKGSKVWQRGYYDRVVRQEGELEAIRQYIRDNPDRWNRNAENIEELLEEKMRLVH
jgi:REP element-mobilizing transposase RayT